MNHPHQKLQSIVENLYKPVNGPKPYWFTDYYLNKLSNDISEYYHLRADGKYDSSLFLHDKFQTEASEIYIHNLSSKNTRSFIGDIDFSKVVYSYEMYNKKEKRMVAIIPSPRQYQHIAFCIYQSCKFDKDGMIESAYLENMVYNHIEKFAFQSVMMVNARFLNHGIAHGDGLDISRILQ